MAESFAADIDSCIEIIDMHDRLRCRLLIGYVLAGGQLFHAEPYGAILPMTPEECTEHYGGDWTAFRQATETRLRALARQTWDAISPSGTIVVPIYGWELGLPYEVDDHGDVVGTWPVVGELHLAYERIVPMAHGALPEGDRHVRPWRLTRGG